MFPVSGKSKYSEQFRKDAVALAASSDHPLRQVARELGVNHEPLRVWVKAAERTEVTPS
jgi:transposase